MKEYLKMSDVFDGEVVANHGYEFNGWSVVETSLGLSIDESGDGGFNEKTADYVAHAINSHDGLVQMNKELLEALNGCAKELTWIIDQHNEQNMEDGSWKYDHQTPWEAMQLVCKVRGAEE